MPGGRFNESTGPAWHGGEQPQALAVEVVRTIDADGVAAVLNSLALQLGARAYVRFDNGPEFVASPPTRVFEFKRAMPGQGVGVSLT